MTSAVVAQTTSKSGNEKLQQSTSKENTTTVNKPAPHTIPVDAIKSMISNYETTRLNTSPNDPRSAWYALNDISSFLEDLKHSAKKNDLNLNDVGVRFYFTVYPEQQTNESSYFKGIENSYRDKLSFVMLPTYKDAQSGENKDILTSDAGGIVSKAFLSASNSAIALNHGGLCPPNCIGTGGGIASLHNIVMTDDAFASHTIPLDAVKSMISNYEVKRLNSNPGDSKSVWYSINELTGFLNDLTLSSENSDLTLENVGVKFYFTVYPDQQSNESPYFKGIEGSYREKLSFVILPTYKDAQSGENIDILSSAENNIVSKTFLLAPNSAIAFNHGGLCPPACIYTGGGIASSHK